MGAKSRLLWVTWPWDLSPRHISYLIHSSSLIDDQWINNMVCYCKGEFQKSGGGNVEPPCSQQLSPASHQLTHSACNFYEANMRISLNMRFMSMICNFLSERPGSQLGFQRLWILNLNYLCKCLHQFKNPINFNSLPLRNVEKVLDLESWFYNWKEYQRCFDPTPHFTDEEMWRPGKPISCLNCGVWIRIHYLLASKCSELREYQGEGNFLHHTYSIPTT